MGVLDVLHIKPECVVLRSNIAEVFRVTKKFSNSRVWKRLFLASVTTVVFGTFASADVTGTQVDILLRNNLSNSPDITDYNNPVGDGDEYFFSVPLSSNSVSVDVDPDNFTITINSGATAISYFRLTFENTALSELGEFSNVEFSSSETGLSSSDFRTL